MRIAAIHVEHLLARTFVATVPPTGLARLAGMRNELESAAVGPTHVEAFLDVDWIAAHDADFDLLHLQLGFDDHRPEQLRGVVAELHRRGKPLVLTVRDLEAMLGVEPARFEAALEALVPVADAVVTLTPSAADAIHARWGRRAEVIPHPHVVPIELVDRPRPDRLRPRVGLHLHSLDPNLDALPMLELLGELVPARGLDLVVDAHAEIADRVPGLERLAGREGIELHVHEPYADDELWSYLQRIDLSVHALCRGTHSGWVEACYDLGTRVLVPRLGSFVDQHAGVHSYALGDDGRPDPADVAAAIDALAAHPRAQWRATRAEREVQLRTICLRHLDLYHRVRSGAAG